jgi:predicted Ser/Thr protein kinase
MDVGAISVAAGQYHYSEGDVVGKGYSSVVYKGTDSITGDHVAIKVVDIRQLKD